MDEIALLEKPNNSYYIKQIFLRVIISVILLGMASGIIINYPVLKPTLIKEGVYSNACPVRNYTDPCMEQNLSLNRLVQIPIGILNVFCIFMSWLVIKFGRKVSVFLASILLSLPLILFGLFYGPDTMPFEYQALLFPFLFLISGTSGNIFSIVAMKYVHELEMLGSRLNTVANGLINAAWDISSIIFWIFAMLYNSGVSLRVLFISYSISVFFPMFLFSFFVVSPYIDNKLASETNTTLSPIREFCHSFRKLPIWLIFLCSACFMSQNYMYISTLPDQILWITGQTSLEGDAYVLNETFGILLPFWGSIFNPLFGYFVLGSNNSKKKTAHRGWLALTIGTAIWSTLSVIKIPNLQYATFVVFIATRIACYSVVVHHTMEFFPGHLFYYTIFGSYSFAGCFILIATLSFTYLDEVTFNNDFTYLNLGLGFASTSIFLSLYFWSRKKSNEPIIISTTLIN